MCKYELYSLNCPFTDEIKYIGITKQGLKKRLSSHLRNPTNFLTKQWFKDLSSKNTKPNIKLIREYNSYEELLNGEIVEIKKYKNQNIQLLNITDGGIINPMLGKTHTQEARNKISKTHKGIKKTEEQKKQQRNILKKYWNDPEWSSKLKKVMSENRKLEKNPNWKGGVKFFCIKCGIEISHGRIHCMKHRPMSGENNPFYGKKHLLKTIQKIKERNINRFGTHNPNFKYNIPKENLYDLYIYQNKTIKEISIIYNCAPNTINKKLREYNIFKPKSNKHNLDTKLIIELLNNGLNYVQIGEKFGCSNKIIHKYIKKHNLYVK